MILAVFNNLPAFILPLVFFGYWYTLGYATLALLHTERCTIRNMALAPAVGLSVTILCVFNFSWFGLPVKTFAWPLCVVLFSVSLGILYYKKPLLSLRRYFPFFMILLVALFITGRPLLDFGFSWLSYLNDDMLNYCLGATRFINYSYFDAPTTKMLASGQDYSLFYWFMSASGSMRSGSELLLAWVSSLTRFSPDQIFMPLILSLHLIVVNVIIALNYTSRKKWYLAFISALLYAASALANLGVFYQLIAQTDGLALLITCIIFMFRKDIPHYKHALFRYGVLCAIVLSAFAIFYPELFSVFVLSYIVYVFSLFVQRKSLSKSLFALIAAVFLCVIILLHCYIFNFVLTGINQATGATVKASALSLFPYFLVPSGLSDLWGFQTIAVLSLEPFLSISILLSGILLIFITVFAINQIWRNQDITAITLITMLLLAVFFFKGTNDFGLFKVAMYIQPFLYSTFTAMIISLFNNKQLLQSMIFLIFGVANLYFGKPYFDRSVSLTASYIPYATQTNMNTTLEKNFLSFVKPNVFLSDTASVVLAKMEALHGKGYTLLFPGKNIFEGIINFGNVLMNTNTYDYLYFSKFNSELLKKSNRLFKFARSTYKHANFYLFPEDHRRQRNSFQINHLPSSTSASLLLQSSSDQSILNRWHTASKNHIPVTFTSLKNIHNYLIFINSGLAEHYYLAKDPFRISANQLERDYFYPDSTFSAIGRYFLFQVIHSSKQYRILFNMTTTLNGDHRNQLPSVAIIGKKRLLFPMVGYGSARTASPAISSQQINGQDYVMMDMQEDGTFFKGIKRKGLMGLYGKSVLLDSRRIIGFGRDISVITENEYQHMKAPPIIEHFPKDLDNPNLEYSGFYEDGWIGSEAYLYLTPLTQKSIFKIQGMVPGVKNNSFFPVLSVWVDKKKIIEHKLFSGNFVFIVPLSLALERHNIEIRFSKTFHLPGADGRPASAQIYTIGFQRDASA